MHKWFVFLILSFCYLTTYTQTIIWSGAVSSNWHEPLNWSSGSVPATYHDIVISNSAVNFPIITQSNVICQNLTIQAGAELSVAPGIGLTVSGNFTNDGMVKLKSGQFSGTATLITNGTIGGNGQYIVEQYLTGSTDPNTGNANGRIWYITSPLGDATSSVFNPQGSNNRLNVWNEPTFSYSQINNNNTVFQPLRGYVVRVGQSAIYEFNGTQLNNGDIDTSLTRTGTSNTNRGFHLIGNPYPSYVSWDDAIKTNLSPTIVYRTYNGNAMVSDAYNSLPGVGTNNNGQGEVTGKLPPFQSVWVKVEGDGNTGYLKFTNSMRSHESGNFLKAHPNNNTLRLYLSDGVNSDETIIVFNPFAGAGFNAWDSEKMVSTSIPQIWTQLSSRRLVINSMPAITSALTVPINYIAPQSGNYTISVNLTDFDAVTSIALRDNQFSPPVVHNLRNGSYSFFSNAGNPISNRFEIIFNSSIPLPVELTHFEAVCQQNKVQLSWTTASEVNCDYFLLEKSNNGIDFIAIAKVVGAGTTNQTTVYTFTDEQMNENDAYYRLTQYDLNGDTKVYEPVYAHCNKKMNNYDIFVYPNPFRDVFYIDGLNSDENYVISLYDLFGNCVFSDSFQAQVQVGLHKQIFHLPSGIYQLRINAKDYSSVFRVIKL